MPTPHDEAETLRQFIKEYTEDCEAEYQQLTESLLDLCLSCALFTVYTSEHGSHTECAVDATPDKCHGPYVSVRSQSA